MEMNEALENGSETTLNELKSQIKGRSYSNNNLKYNCIYWMMKNSFSWYIISVFILYFAIF